MTMNPQDWMGTRAAAERHGITQRHARLLAQRAVDAGKEWPQKSGHDYFAPIAAWDELLHERPTRGGKPRKYRLEERSAREADERTQEGSKEQ